MASVVSSCSDDDNNDPVNGFIGIWELNEVYFIWGERKRIIEENEIGMSVKKLVFNSDMNVNITYIDILDKNKVKSLSTKYKLIANNQLIIDFYPSVEIYNGGDILNYTLEGNELIINRSENFKNYFTQKIYRKYIKR